MDTYAERWHFQGSVLVSLRGKVLLRKGYGFAVAEHAVPNKPESKFGIASISKGFAAMAILQLMERGLLELEDPVKQYLPGLYRIVHRRIRGEEYVALHFSNNVVFTYIYAVEVSELGMIPEGMIGLTVPGSRYARARSRDEDPYELIHNFISENGLSSNPAVFSLEVFRMGVEESKYHADIFVPIKEEEGYKPFVVPSSVKTIRDYKQEPEQQRSNGNVERKVPASREESTIKTVSCIELPVRNMQRAVDFYVFQLGFYMNTAKNHLPIEPGNTEVFIYPEDGVKIMLIQTDGEERLTFTHKGKPNHVLILEVEEDIQECHIRLANAGLTITPIKDSGGCGKSFDVYDPEGNLIKLWFGYPS